MSILTIATPAGPLTTPSSWLYFAQRARTGAWLDRAGLPLADATLTWDLAADSFTAAITPDYALALAADGLPVLDEWSTLLYAVADGIIRWGGILTHSEQAGPAWQLSATGFRGYPAGIPYLGPDYKQTAVNPLDVIRMLWAHLQSYGNGNLGLTVDSSATSAARIGGGDQPYELAPWNSTDIGQEITTLAKVVPAEMAEAHAFADDGESVSHTLTFGVPRVGRRRDDLRFTEDENLAAVVPLTRDGAYYANAVAGVGAGEGSAAITAQAALDDGRLRRVATYQDQAITGTDVLRGVLNQVLAARLKMGGAAQAEIINHPNAPSAAVGVGDDILLQFTSGWAAGQQIWHRVTAVTLKPETGRTTLTLARSDSFSYAPAG